MPHGASPSARSIFAFAPQALVASLALAIGAPDAIHADEPAPRATENGENRPPNSNSEDLPPDHAARMAQGLELFHAEIRAILENHCLKCHGGEKTLAEFDLGSRESLLKGGESGPAIVVGKPDESTLIKLARHEAEPHMPHEADKLPDEIVSRLARWIELGAPFDKPLVENKNVVGSREVTEHDRDFWSFRPLTPQAPPETKDTAWPRNPIDQFLLAALEAKGIAPNGAVERRVWLRRATFDLTGLPPTPEEISDFESDSSPRAFENVLDRLLASPNYGERWARHWLDLARFGESHGYEQDYDRPTAYHFRDFVIEALNQDMPYDRFTRWQIAGDEYAPENPLAMKATGFLAAGTHATQITANQAEKERYDELDDMGATIGAAFLGLSVGCARCHDHKFDPIPQRDYYRFIATFTKTVRSELDLDLDPAGTKKARDEFDRTHAPLVAELARFERDVAPGRLDAWLASGASFPTPVWHRLEHLEIQSAGGASFAPRGDGSYLASGPNAEHDTYTITALAPLAGVTAIKLEALADPSFVKGGPGRAENGNFALSDFRVQVANPSDGQSPVTVKLVRPRATFEQANLPIAAAIDEDPGSAWAVDPQFGQNQACVFEFETPAGNAAGATFTFTLKFDVNQGHSIGRPRISLCTQAGPPDIDGESLPLSLVVDAAAALAKPAGERTEADRAKLLARFRSLDEEWRARERAVHEHAQLEPKPNLTKVLVSSEGTPAVRLHTQGPDFYEETFYLKRGDLRQKVSQAAPGFLQILTQAPEGDLHWPANPPAGARTSFHRKALADWITDERFGAGRLLARVIVNRLWEHHFGRGIVATPSDFGAQGERPTHPELLDWLAIQLIQEGWRLKPIHKLMMSSAAYAQSAEYDAPRAAIDPDNRLFWRRPWRRLEAEAIRDAMLAVSGDLDSTRFGPGTLDENHRRRSIYFTIKRSQLVPLMMLFDAPDSLQGIGLRPSTTIAPQALALMNDPQVRGYARSFARRLAPRLVESPENALRQAYEIALGRPPLPDEISDSMAFWESQTASYRESRGDAAGEAALADFLQALFGLNEFLYVQ